MESQQWARLREAEAAPSQVESADRPSLAARVANFRGKAMSKIINPLFANKSAKTEVVSGVSPSSVPQSPISGQPMVSARCHNIPVYVDMENRVVVPVRQTS